MSSKSRCIGVLGCALGLALGACGSTGEDPPANGGAGLSGGGAGGGAGSGMPGAGTGGGTAGTMSGGSGTGGTMSGGGTGGTMSGGGTGGSTGGTGGAPPATECDPNAMDIQTGAMCADNATGIFAIKTVIDVWWQDDMPIPLVDAGRDKITVYLMGDLTGVCPDGTGGVGVMKGCGTELPPFKSDANCDVFQIEIPNEVWDQPTMPTFTTGGSTTGFNPGDMLTIATATGLVGISLMDENGPWPTPMQTGTFACMAGMGAQCFPDHDGDDKPGISIRMGKIGETFSTGDCGGFNLDYVYRGAPLDAISALDDNSVRATTMQIGLRTRLGGGGAIGADCNSGVGDSVAEFLDSRVLDCQKTNSMNCTTAEATFVDEQAPTYHILDVGEHPPETVLMMGTSTPIDQTPSVGTRSALVRLGDAGGGFTCENVRNAAYPAL